MFEQLFNVLAVASMWVMIVLALYSFLVKGYREQSAKDALLPNFDTVRILVNTVKRFKGTLAYSFSVVIVLESLGRTPVERHYDLVALMKRFSGDERYSLGGGGSLRQQLRRDGYGRKWPDSLFSQIARVIEGQLNDYLDRELAEELSKGI